MAEAASLVAAVAAVGALYFAWRTVAEARAAHREDQRDRQLARIEALGVALTEFAAALSSGGIAPGRVLQACSGAVDHRQGCRGRRRPVAVVTPITAANAAELAAKAESGIEALLTGLEEILAVATR